jgi:hypothetical protein
MASEKIGFYPFYVYYWELEVSHGSAYVVSLRRQG